MSRATARDSLNSTLSLEPIASFNACYDVDVIFSMAENGMVTTEDTSRTSRLQQDVVSAFSTGGDGCNEHCRLSAQSQSVASQSKDVEKIGAGLDPSSTLGAGEVDPLNDPNGEISYKTMSWWHVGMLMIAETISLGILSLPGAVAALGLIPGIFSILILGLLATYSGYVIGQFKLRHPSVHSFADAGSILFGRFGYHLFCWAALLSLIFIMAAHILTFSVAMNVLTNNKTCSVLWAVIGFGISVLLTLPRTLKNVSYFSIASFISITSAVLLVMISLGASDHSGITDVYLIQPSYTLTPTFLALLNICIAFMGNVAFFGFISELRNPADFPKSLALNQICSVTFYLIVGCVIYHYIGTANMVSPALSAASPQIQKIAYGIAMPTIIVAGVINAHVSCKQVYVQLWSVMLHDPVAISEKSWRSVGSWVGIVTAQWVIALVLALAVPVFNEMLGLISALFGSWFTYGVCGMLWLSLEWERVFGPREAGPVETIAEARASGDASEAETNASTGESGDEGKEQAPEEPSRGFWNRMGISGVALSALNVFMLVVGATLCGLGLYTSVKSIMESEVSKPFSC